MLYFYIQESCQEKLHMRSDEKFRHYSGIPTVIFLAQVPPFKFKIAPELKTNVPGKASLIVPAGFIPLST